MLFFTPLAMDVDNVDNVSVEFYTEFRVSMWRKNKQKLVDPDFY